MGGELGIYPTLGQAFDASFADWYPESMHGDFNDDVTEYIVDGQWLIKEAIERDRNQTSNR